MQQFDVKKSVIETKETNCERKWVKTKEYYPLGSSNLVQGQEFCNMYHDTLPYV